MKFLSENSVLVLDFETKVVNQGSNVGKKIYLYDLYFGKSEIITFNSDIDLKLQSNKCYRLLLGITPKVYNGRKYNSYTIEKVIHD